MKILVVNGHPKRESLVSALVERYVDGARSQEHDVEVVRLSDLHLEPYTTYEHGSDRPVVTPELEAIREQLVWADHYLVAYPVWWGPPLHSSRSTSRSCSPPVSPSGISHREYDGLMGYQAPRQLG